MNMALVTFQLLMLSLNNCFSRLMTGRLRADFSDRGTSFMKKVNSLYLGLSQ